MRHVLALILVLFMGPPASNCASGRNESPLRRTGELCLTPSFSFFLLFLIFFTLSNSAMQVLLPIKRWGWEIADQGWRGVFSGSCEVYLCLWAGRGGKFLVATGKVDELPVCSIYWDCMQYICWLDLSYFYLGWSHGYLFQFYSVKSVN